MGELGSFGSVSWAKDATAASFLEVLRGVVISFRFRGLYWGVISLRLAGLYWGVAALRLFWLFCDDDTLLGFLTDLGWNFSPLFLRGVAVDLRRTSSPVFMVTPT